MGNGVSPIINNHNNDNSLIKIDENVINESNDNDWNEFEKEETNNDTYQNMNETKVRPIRPMKMAQNEASNNFEMNVNDSNPFGSQAKQPRENNDGPEKLKDSVRKGNYVTLKI